MLPRKARVAMWYYKDNVRNYPGIHMTADAMACQWISARLTDKALNIVEMMDLIPPSTAILAVPNNWLNTARHVGFTRARFTIDETQQQPVRIVNEFPHIKINVNAAGRDALLQGIRDIEAGKGDYCIGEDGSELWFWWFPAKL